MAGVSRFSSPRWPRFVLDSLHRNVSLLAVAFLLVHILTAVLDSFAPISLTDAIVPFGGSYRPFWLGLGAVAFDLLLAVALTSIVRRRLGYGAWRATHWLAYACWPIALLHGLGTGSDVKSTWLLALNIALPGGRRAGGGRPCDRRLAGACPGPWRRARRDGRLRAVPRALAARWTARAWLGAPLGHAYFATGRVVQRNEPANRSVAGLPRLLTGMPAHGAMGLAEHLAIHGELPFAKRRERRGARGR